MDAFEPWLSVPSAELAPPPTPNGIRYSASGTSPSSTATRQPIAGSGRLGGASTTGGRAGGCMVRPWRAFKGGEA